jgi:hypothetical protein
MAESKIISRFPKVPRKQSRNPETTADGRYIPYSGGSMGWFQNSGVLKSELPNDYGFHKVMDAESVRAKMFERWGMMGDERHLAGLSKQDRPAGVHQQEAKGPIAVRLVWDGGSADGMTKDLSHYGMRIQVTDPLKVEEGHPVKAQLLTSDGDMILEIDSTVAWIKEEVVIRALWSVGIAFTQITSETEEALRDFLGM